MRGRVFIFFLGPPRRRRRNHASARRGSLRDPSKISRYAETEDQPKMPKNAGLRPNEFNGLAVSFLGPRALSTWLRVPPRFDGGKNRR